MIGAWDDDKLVGFVLGFLGTDEGDPNRPAMTRLKHCSHMLAVLPDYRDKGVGYQLKIAQYHAVNQQAVRLITWTFDPVESRNANLNIARLGAISRTYKRDNYGEMNDGLNVGFAFGSSASGMVDHVEPSQTTNRRRAQASLT